MKHGTANSYKNLGCRCPDCTAAAVAYNCAYRRRRAAAGPVLVDAGETREHIRRLVKSGLTIRGISRIAGLGHRCVKAIYDGTSQRILPQTADAILATPLGTMIGERRVPADKARRLIEAMGEAGVSRTAIGRALRYSYPAGFKLARNTYISRRSFDRIATIYRYCASRGIVPYSLLEEVSQ